MSSMKKVHVPSQPKINDLNTFSGVLHGQIDSWVMYATTAIAVSTSIHCLYSDVLAW